MTSKFYGSWGGNFFKKIPKSINSLLAAYKDYSRALMYLKSMGLAAVIYQIPK